MRGGIKRSICELCSVKARKRCQSARTNHCDRLLDTFEKADIIGAKYALFASGRCIFA